MQTIGLPDKHIKLQEKKEIATKTKPTNKRRHRLKLLNDGKREIQDWFFFPLNVEFYI
jgi:hypothetical protein